MWAYRLGLWLVRNRRGSSSLEQALIAALTAAVASVFAAGVGKTGVTSAQQSKQHVQRSAAEAQATLSQRGPLFLLAQRYNGTASVNYGDQKRTLRYPPVITQMYFYVENRGNQPVNVNNLTVNYADRTQRTRLCSGGVSISGRTVICNGGAVRLYYHRGQPLAGGAASKGVPTIKRGDYVRVHINTSGLGTQLSARSQFQIQLLSSGRPFSVRNRTDIRGFGWNRR